MAIKCYWTLADTHTERTTNVLPKSVLRFCSLLLYNFTFIFSNYFKLTTQLTFFLLSLFCWCCWCCCFSSPLSKLSLSFLVYHRFCSFSCSTSFNVYAVRIVHTKQKFCHVTLRSVFRSFYWTIDSWSYWECTQKEEEEKIVQMSLYFLLRIYPSLHNAHTSTLYMHWLNGIAIVPLNGKVNF